MLMNPSVSGRNSKCFPLLDNFFVAYENATRGAAAKSKRNVTNLFCFMSIQLRIGDKISQSFKVVCVGLVYYAVICSVELWGQ